MQLTPPSSQIKRFSRLHDQFQMKDDLTPPPPRRERERERERERIVGKSKQKKFVWARNIYDKWKNLGTVP